MKRKPKKRYWHDLFWKEVALVADAIEHEAKVIEREAEAIEREVARELKHKRKKHHHRFVRVEIVVDACPV